MEGGRQRTIRRRPVPIDVKFDDFDLQPLNPQIQDKDHELITHNTDLESDNGEDNRSTSVPGLEIWTPFYLRRHVLLTFIGVFAACLFTLAALFGYSQQHQGLSTADEKLYYLWTYGPTAVFTTIGVFWGQVVYRVKQLTPWKSMADGVQPASKSIAADYISPITPVAMYRAFSNSDRSVGFALLSSLLFTVLTITSTGLFTQQRINVLTRDVSLSITSSFNLSNFDWSSVDSRPAALAYGAQYLGLDFPSGTTAQYAVQGFSSPQSSFGTISAVVDTFSAWLECESVIFNATSINDFPFPNSAGNVVNTALGDVRFNLSVTKPDCTITSLVVDAADGTSLDRWLLNETYLMGWGKAQIVDCNEPNDSRIFGSVGDFEVAVPPGSSSPSSPYAIDIINSTSILCHPKYDVKKCLVQKQTNAALGSVIKSITPIRNSSNQTGTTTDIALGVFQSINSPNNPVLNEENDFEGFGNDGYSLDAFVKFLVTAGPALGVDHPESDFWLQADHLAARASALYSSVAVQMASIAFLKPADDQLLGETTMNEQRLFVRMLSFIIMEICLAIQIVMASYLLLSESCSIVSHDPGSIAGLAAILVDSSELTNIVCRAGHLEISRIRSLLHGNLYRTSLKAVNPARYTTKIKALRTAHDDISGTEEPPSASIIQWWQPLILKFIFQLLIVTTPLIYIGILESLLSRSESNDGLFNVQSDTWVHYAWTYAPALLMVCLRVAYDAVNFSIQTLSPYSTLQKKPAPASIGLEDHPLSRVALHQFLVSARRRQLSAFTATAGALLAPLLTIVVSGLYKVDNLMQEAKVQQLTGWHFDNGQSPNSTLLEDVFEHLNQSIPFKNGWSSSSGAQIADLVITTNFSYPRGTYDELVLPMIEITSLGLGDQELFAHLNGSLQIQLPAIRGGLNCSTLAHDKVNITYAMYHWTDNELYLDPWNNSWVMPTAGNRPDQSNRVFCSQGDDDVTASCRVAVFSLAGGQTLEGCPFAPESVFLPRGNDSQRFGYFSSLEFQNATNSTNCPVYGGMFGSFSADEIEDYTWFFCSTFAERVTADTTFTLPNYNISTAIVQENTAAQVMSNATSPIGDELYGQGNSRRTPPKIALGVNLLPPIEVTDFLDFYNATGGQNYDNFFSVLINGPNGIDGEQLSGQDNISRLLSAVQHLWRVIYAQHIRAVPYYISADPEDIKAFAPLDEWTGTFKDASRYRLKQSVVSTRILQSILGTLSLCAVVTFLSMDTRKVLPNNPSSIAVVASLLAGSEMLKIAASPNHTQIKSNPWQGYFFSLGWWNLSDGTRRFGIDIGRADKAS